VEAPPVSYLLLWLALPAVVALPMGCVGLILRLCEWSWEKPAGNMGSFAIVLIAAMLCLPLTACLTWIFIHNVISSGRLF